MLCVIVCAWVGGNLQELFPARVLRDILVLEYLPSSCGVSGTSPSTTTHMEKEIFFFTIKSWKYYPILRFLLLALYLHLSHFSINMSRATFV